MKIHLSSFNLGTDYIWIKHNLKTALSLHHRSQVCQHNMFEQLFWHFSYTLIKVTKSLALTSPAQQEQTWQERQVFQGVLQSNVWQRGEHLTLRPTWGGNSSVCPAPNPSSFKHTYWSNANLISKENPKCDVNINVSIFFQCFRLHVSLESGIQWSHISSYATLCS